MKQTLIRIAESRGIADALEGVPPTACPYRRLDLRTAWMRAYRSTEARR